MRGGRECARCVPTVPKDRRRVQRHRSRPREPRPAAPAPDPIRRVRRPAGETMTLDLADVRRTSYELGGRAPGVGLDCLGVCLVIAERLGIPSPDPWRAIAE